MVFTDGASQNPGASGIGVVITRCNKVLEEFGEHIGIATANQAELLAIERAVESSGAARMTIKTDSKYCIKVLHDYRNERVQVRHNLEILERLRPIILARNILIEHVPAHKGYEHNERADTLAKLAMKNGGNDRARRH